MRKAGAVLFGCLLLFAAGTIPPVSAIEMPIRMCKSLSPVGGGPGYTICN
jgi:hypothetical protein